MTVFIDTSTAFIENKDFTYSHKTKVNLTTKERFKVVKNFNCLSKEGVYNISFFGGLNSSYSKNQILNSNFYNSDTTLGKNHTPFNDSEDYYGNKIETLMNPAKRCITYGQDNASEQFEEMKNFPFEDIDSDESIKGYFFNAKNITYPKYFSDYSIDQLSSSISFFGIIESLTYNTTNLKNLRGIKLDIVSNSSDARGRQINLVNSKRYVNQESNIESFYDVLDDNNITNEANKITGNFEYTQTVLNERNIFVFNSGSQYQKVINKETSSEFYVLSDNDKIKPFDDRNTLIFNTVNDLIELNTGYNDYDVFYTTGTNNNNINGGLPESIVFIGDLN